MAETLSKHPSRDKKTLAEEAALTRWLEGELQSINPSETRQRTETILQAYKTRAILRV